VNPNSQEVASQFPLMTQQIDQFSSLSNNVVHDSKMNERNDTPIDDLSPYSQKRRLALTQAFHFFSPKATERKIGLELSVDKCDVSGLLDNHRTLI
jgi:hypothetical protein